MTAHIEAKVEDIASVVIMPGDPKRAEMIANTYLENCKKVNEVRGILAFTGYYKGKRITVMASGMGMPSIGIYSYELYKFYNVDTIIRVGTTGAFDPTLKIYDVILVSKSYSDSSFAKVQNGNEDTILTPSSIVNDELENAALKLGVNIHKGCVYSTDVFYKDVDYKSLFEKRGCIATEMESFALFHNASVLRKKAACLLTVSDHFITKEQTTSEERQKSFNQMIEIALEAVK